MNDVSKYYICCVDKMFKGGKVERIPRLCEYDVLLNKKITLDKLKHLKKRYNVRGTYKKMELAERLYNIMRIKYSVKLIIKIYKKYMLMKYEKLLGGNNYVNTEDFESLELLEDIDVHDLVGIEEDGKVYGFNILSFENLLIKYKDSAFNPYTRSIIDGRERNRFKKIIHLKRIFKYGTNVRQMEVLENTIRVRLQDLFYKINSLGNYADSDWIEELSKDKLVKYIYELADIWEYRANLSQDTKSRIYINMNPFSDVRLSRLPLDTQLVLQNKVIRVIERFISSNEQVHASLGAFYVLGALTLVNNNAAEALPWLYQSFYHTNV